MGEGTTRMGTDTPVHHPERPAGSTPGLPGAPQDEAGLTRKKSSLVNKLVTLIMLIKMEVWDFPGGPVVGKSPSSAEGAASIPS